MSVQLCCRSALARDRKLDPRRKPPAPRSRASALLRGFAQQTTP